MWLLRCAPCAACGLAPHLVNEDARKGRVPLIVLADLRLDSCGIPGACRGVHVPQRECARSPHLACQPQPARSILLSARATVGVCDDHTRGALDAHPRAGGSEAGDYVRPLHRDLLAALQHAGLQGPKAALGQGVPV